MIHRATIPSLGEIMSRPAAILFFAILAAAAVTGADVLRLKEGKRLRGHLVSESDSVVVFWVADKKEPTRVPRSQVSWCRGGEGFDGPCAPGWPTDPAGDGLFFLPTAFTPPKGAVDVKGFEVLYLSLGYAPTASTSLSAGTVMGWFWTAGVKQQIWRDADARTAIALSGGVSTFSPLVGSFDPLEFQALASATVSRRFPRGWFRDALGIHATAGFWGSGFRDYRYSGGVEDGWSYRWTNNPLFGAGIEARLAPQWKLLAEYASPDYPAGRAFFFDLASDNAESSTGFLNAGVRYHNRQVSVDAAVIATAAAYSDEERPSAVFLPLLILGYRF
jgi:hypothetical protein